MQAAPAPVVKADKVPEGEEVPAEPVKVVPTLMVTIPGPKVGQSVK